jgi:1-acyl-sn-glycerol-3-phosphate acyltransferase
MDFWYGWEKFVMGSYLRISGVRAEVTGLENIPDGPKIVVGNHPNATDTLHLPFLFKEKVVGLAENNLLQMPIVGRWLRLAGNIPVVAGRGEEALRAAHERLLQGNVVLIYPEGKLSRTHEIEKWGTGVARLALAEKVPVLPFGVYVPEKYLRVFRGRTKEGRPTAGAWQVRGKTYFRIGQPLAVAQQRANEETHSFYRRFTDEIMQSVAALSAQAKDLAGIE